MAELLEASDLNVIDKDFKDLPRANRTVSVIMGILATVGWLAIVVLIGEQS